MCYSGIQWKFVDPKCFSVPQYCTLRNEHKYFLLEVPTEYTANGLNVKFIYERTEPLNFLTMSVRDEIISLHDVGILPNIEISCSFISGLLKLTETFALCKGRILPNTTKSKAIRHITWNYVHGEESTEYMSHHSRRCTVVLKVTRNEKTNNCEHCTRDINHVLQSLQNEQLPTENDAAKNNNDNVQNDGDNHEDDLVPEWINLEQKDNQDFATIFEQIKMKAPNFDILMKSQMENAKHTDPRQRRWDTAMISFCLQAWTQY